MEAGLNLLEKPLVFVTCPRHVPASCLDQTLLFFYFFSVVFIIFFFFFFKKKKKKKKEKSKEKNKMGGLLQGFF